MPLQGEPVIDDITCMDEMRESARVVRSLGDYTDIAIALLVSSFYFELAALPRLEGGHGRSDAIIQSLFNLYGGRLNDYRYLATCCALKTHLPCFNLSL